MQPPLLLNDINLENYIAMCEAVEEFGKYENAGESFGQKLNSEGYVIDESLLTLPKSKYSFDWDEYKKENPYAPESMKATLEGYDAQMVNSVFNMVI
jgi:hypothetical protein